jgi:uncharacterized delta-60 repeat protein
VGPDADPDRYVLGTAVGSGAEGILYRGSITTAAGVRLEVAIKMLQPRFLARVQEWHTRWMEQVELLRSLQVPGVVPVRDGFLGPLPHPPGTSGEGRTLYLVMNWVDGEPLDEWIRHRPDRDPVDDLKVLVPVAAALDLMHSGRATGSVPVVHRDVKPSNILVTDHGSVLVDFGLTRGLPDGQRLTAVVGTPGYMAPESTDDGSYSPASDRYGFGAVAYFVLTGFEPPPGHQPDVLQSLVAAVPALADQPDLVDHVAAMLATDPDTRPPGLANWIGQLRRSSLDAGPDILNPPAPRRHPAVPGRRAKPRTGRQAASGRSAILVAGAVIVVLALFAVVTAELLSDATAPKTTVASQLAFDPTCGHGKPVSFSPFSSDSIPPTDVIVESNHATIGANARDLSDPGFGTGSLLGIDANCSPDPTFSPSGMSSIALQSPSGTATLAALAIGPNGDIYAAGHSQSGWVVARFLPRGALDQSFGSGGYATITEAGLQSVVHNNAYASSIAVAPSGKIFVFGNDNNPGCCGKSLLIALRGDGSLDPTFGNHGVVTADQGVYAASLTMTHDGHLLLGSSPAGGAAQVPCSEFTLEEYRSSGLRESRFTKVVGTGTGAFCPGVTTKIPGFDFAHLTSVLALPGGDFFAFGFAFTDTNPVAIAGHRYGAFLVKYHADGSIDPSFGRDGILTLPVGVRSPVNGISPVEQTGALAEPGGGVVVAIAGEQGISLVLLTPTGGVDKRVQVPAAGQSPSFALGDAGGGKVLVVSEASGVWSVARYLDDGS